MAGNSGNDRTRSLPERGLISPERTPELFMKPMDRIRRAMALRRAHEEIEAGASMAERDTRESDADALRAEAERRRLRAAEAARAAETKRG